MLKTVEAAVEAEAAVCGGGCGAVEAADAAEAVKADAAEAADAVEALQLLTAVVECFLPPSSFNTYTGAFYSVTVLCNYAKTQRSQ